MSLHTSIDGVVREIKSLYTSFDGVVHEIKEEYTGVDGVVRKLFASIPNPYYPILNDDYKIGSYCTSGSYWDSIHSYTSVTVSSGNVKLTGKKSGYMYSGLLMLTVDTTVYSKMYFDISGVQNEISIVKSKLDNISDCKYDMTTFVGYYTDGNNYCIDLSSYKQYGVVTLLSMVGVFSGGSTMTTNISNIRFEI